jgi:hypothetical protein
MEDNFCLTKLSLADEIKGVVFDMNDDGVGSHGYGGHFIIVYEIFLVHLSSHNVKDSLIVAL